jgi:type II secretory pathway pseudopilin PulG
MIVVAIIAIIASVAIPKLLSARLAANEATAISTLRLLTTAQEQMRGRGSIDTDSDGAGEFGYFGELTGTVPMRKGVGGAPAPGVLGVDDLTPAILAAAFGRVDAQSLTTRSGYHFQLWLPGTPVGALTPAIAELATIGGANPASFPDSDASEVLWCAYAWPVDTENTGNRAFFVNQDGSLMQCANRGAVPYGGTVKMPAFDEAYVTPGDMSSAIRAGMIGGNDGTFWTNVQ